MVAHVMDPVRVSAETSARRRPSVELIASLRSRFGSRLSTADSVLLQHGSDESSYRPQPPDAVVFVLSTEEAAFVVSACAREDVPVIAFGVGSSIEGHLLAVRSSGRIAITFCICEKSTQTPPSTASR